MDRLRRLALGVAIAATPAVAHASKVVTSTFNCDPANNELNSINWGDVPLHPTAGLLLPAVMPPSPFSCSAPTELTGGTEFGVFFDAIDAAQKADLKIDKWFLDTQYKDYKESIGDGQYKEVKITNFDIYSVNSDGLAKFFVDVKLDTAGNAIDNSKIYVNDAGTLVLDPPIFNNAVDISLYNSPQVPEPTSLTLAGAGLAAAAASLRRRRRKNPW